MLEVKQLFFLSICDAEATVTARVEAAGYREPLLRVETLIGWEGTRRKTPLGPTGPSAFLKSSKLDICSDDVWQLLSVHTG